MKKDNIVGDIFVSRNHEIEKLTDHLDWVEKNNKVRLVFVHGEAGSGKTTLVKNFLKSIPKKQKVITGWGICSLERQGNGLVPFAKILDSVSKQVVDWKIVGGSFAEFLGNVAPAWLDLVSFGFASPVATTLKEGVKLVKKQKVSFTLEHVFIQFTNAIEHIAKKRPTVFVIEDLHWADKSSLELLFHLVRNIEDCPLLILVTYRTVEAMQSGEYASDFQTIRANLIKDSNTVQEIVLTMGLDVREYLQKRYNSLILADGIITRIQEETEGHAIYVAELFNLWEQTGEIVFDGTSWQLSDGEINIALPPNFREVLQQRIKNLNEQLREIITRASVEGDDFTVQTIAKLLEIEEYKMFDEVEALEKNYHLIFQKGSEEISKVIFDFYHFAHRFIQQHIYEELSEGKRRILHRQLGLCLEELCVDRNQVAAQLARHFYIGSVIDKAVKYALQAAQYEQTRYMWNEAHRWASLASEWLDKLSTSDETDLYRFQIKSTFGDIFYYQAKYVEAEFYYKEALELSNQIICDPNLVGDVYVTLSDICDETNRYDEGYKLIIEGKSFLQGHSIYSGEIYFELIDMESLLLCRLGKIEDAFQTICNLITIVEEYPSEESLQKVLASAYHSKSIILGYMGNFSESIPSYLKAIEIFSGIGHLSRQCFALAALTEDYLYTGQLEKAKSSSSRAIEISRQIGDISGESYGLYTQSLILLELGSAENAIQNIEQAIKLVQKTGAIPYFYYSDGALAFLQKDIDKALEYANKGKLLAGSRKFAEAYALKNLGVVEAARQNWDQAVEYFGSAKKIFHEINDEHQLALTQKVYGKMLMEIGQVDEANEILTEAMMGFEDLDIQHEVENIKLILGNYDR